MNWTERRERFRALLAGNRCVHPGSVYDAISARIAEDLGFEVGIFSGSIGSMAVLGAPDLVVLTLTEFAAQANRVCRAGNLASWSMPITATATRSMCGAPSRNWRRPASARCRSRIPCCRAPMARRQAELDPGRGGRRQDEGGAVGAPGSRTSSSPGAPARWRSPTSTTRSSGPRPTRRPGSTRSSSPAASPSRRSRRFPSQIKIPLITGGGAGPLADLDWMAAHRVRVALAGARAVQRRGAGGLQHAEGAARRREAERPAPASPRPS